MLLLISKAHKEYKGNVYIKLNQLVNSFLSVSMSTFPQCFKF